METVQPRQEGYTFSGLFPASELFGDKAPIMHVLMQDYKSADWLAKSYGKKGKVEGSEIHNKVRAQMYRSQRSDIEQKLQTMVTEAIVDEQKVDKEDLAYILFSSALNRENLGLQRATGSVDSLGSLPIELRPLKIVRWAREIEITKDGIPDMPTVYEAGKAYFK